MAIKCKTKGGLFVKSCLDYKNSKVFLNGIYVLEEQKSISGLSQK